MDTNDDKANCALSRQYLDARLAEDTPPLELTVDRRTQIENHLSTCADCISWQKQTTELIAAASAMPQFDVPEGLTQRILADATLESARKGSMFRSMAFYAIAIGTLFVLLQTEKIETTDGLFSWFIGIAAMFAFAWIVRDSAGTAVVRQR